MKTKIESIVDISLDNILYSLKETLTTDELVDFCISIGDGLTDEESFYKLLKKKVDKIYDQYE